MLGGKKKDDLDLRTILSKVSEYDIYRYYLNHDFELGRKMTSPFRSERNASFSIDLRNSGLRFMDFGADEYHGGVIDFVMMLHPGMDYNGALERIDKDMGLGIRHKDTDRDYKKIIKDYRPPADVTEKKCIIDLIKRPYTKEELAFWNEFHQSEDDLKMMRIWSINKLYMNYQKFPLKPTELRFAYEFGEGRYKIYRPFAAKEDKFFPNNTYITDMDGWDYFEGKDPVDIMITTKSRKDYAVLKKVFGPVVAVQNEGTGCFSEGNVELMKKYSKRNLIAFDSDDPGKIASMRVTTKYGFGHVNVPDKYLPEINDFAEFGRKMGLDAITDYFKQKGIIR